MFIAFPYRRKAQLKELFYEKGKEERSGAGPNSGEGTGNYEYVIPMEHEFVFWNEAAQRFLTRDDNKLTLYDRYGRAQTDGCLRLSELHEKIRDVDGIGRVGKNFSER